MTENEQYHGVLTFLHAPSLGATINYNQYIQNKIKNKSRMKAIDYASFKLEIKATRKAKKNKNNFIKGTSTDI